MLASTASELRTANVTLVEIADAADLASATHREIQRVTTWTDTAVTFVPAKGTLPAGPAWAFVIGPDDQVLASQSITLD